MHGLDPLSSQKKILIDLQDFDFMFVQFLKKKTTSKRPRSSLELRFTIIHIPN